MLRRFFVLACSLGIALQMPLFGQELYFPSGSTWEQTSPQSLAWNMPAVDSLYNFLEQNDTKAFIVLHRGRIVLERYFGTFERDSNWYWASAGKTLTATLTGIALQEGKLSLDQPTSDFLGKGWTSLTAEQEQAITIRHQLTMTSGLSDRISDPDCTTPDCLTFTAPAGERWAYHNAPYTLLEKVIEQAVGQNYNTYFARSIRNKIGMNGIWLKQGFNNVYFSNARSMARFGLLILNKGIWQNDTILTDTMYLNAMIRPSQELNKSYGYLWWLNGQSSYMLPTLQIVFPNMLAPKAPADVISALGKNGQICTISPAEGLVVVRMGNPPSGPGSAVPTTFLNTLWDYVQKARNVSTSVPDSATEARLAVYPNPAQQLLNVVLPQHRAVESVELRDILGNKVIHIQHPTTERLQLPLQMISSGWYSLVVAGKWGVEQRNVQVVK